MTKSYVERLREICAIDGVSSREDKVIKYMYDAFKAHTDDVTVDMLGNVTAHFPADKPDAQRILIFAHMDEVGLIVKRVREDGYLLLERVSAVNSHIIPGTLFNVRSHSGELIPGVMGAKSHHYMKPEEKTRMPELSEMALDIGCRSKEEVSRLNIDVGCVVSFAPHFTCLQNNIVTTKSVDDRIACLALIDLAEHVKGKKLPFELFICASVQEEFNIRGIMPAARKADPDIAIGLDISPAGDSPDLAGANDVRLGGGPSFTYLNYHGRGTLAGLVPNEKLVQYLEGVCRSKDIPFQREVGRGLLTETAYIQISGSKGVATAAISIPTRYAHTPVETVCLDDLERTVELLKGFTDSWDGSVSLYKI